MILDEVLPKTMRSEVRRVALLLGFLKLREGRGEVMGGGGEEERRRGEGEGEGGEEEQRKKGEEGKRRGWRGGTARISFPHWAMRLSVARSCFALAFLR